MRLAAPLLMDTAALRHLKCSATRATSSSLALPSIGADLSRASQVPPSTASNALVRELGLTLTRITVAVICFIALRLTARGQAGDKRGDSAHAHLDNRTRRYRSSSSARESSP